MAPARVAYVLRSWPRLSQTFVLDEILDLERLGQPIHIYGMIPSGEPLAHEQLGALEAPAEFLEPALARPWSAHLADHLDLLRWHPWRYLSTVAYVALRRDLVAGYTTTTRRAALLQATYLARRLRRDDVAHVHSHFAHDPTLIALLVKKLTGVTYSFTAHARDIHQLPASALLERIEHARAVVTICEANVEHLRRVAPAAAPKLRLVRTGIDVDLFRPSARAGTRAPPTIAVVSRLVAKKGLLDLVEALALVRARFRCVIVGEGPLRDQLQAAVTERGLAENVVLLGAATRGGVLRLLRSADLFALTPFVTEDGDRDGLPVAILEAMACGLPVVATRVAGIPEAVVPGDTGFLAPARDVAAIARHLEALLADEGLRRRLGDRARAAILREWRAPTSAGKLAALFGEIVGAAP